MQITATALINGVTYSGTFTRVQPKRFEDLSPEMQADTLASRAKYDAIEAERRAITDAANREAESIARGQPVWFRSAPNVSLLDREQALVQIEEMSELIQSGEADKLPLYTAKGTQTTSNYRQYVYWLQQHVKELEGGHPATDVKV
ncbi:hypothetical protein FNB15_13475 [Ferrovibrio terrae]|uniref:Uncharacterized protein n=1 Tax=Ferrovibrio terrae TaxID=2594003 RepID=A0A516H372_9PROT|nr:hypothetical protein [Ferrovibrio terrae]QDO98217.1 hypothetical protein FNB15_13475 [Ferrovibrio terrae]